MSDETGSDILYNLTHFPRPYVSDCTGCQNLSNLTHQGTREMFRIVQDVRTCLIWHTKGRGKCEVLTSCTIRHISLVPWNVRLDRFWHPVQSDTFPWSLGMSDETGFDILYNPKHFPGPLVCQIRQVLTSCTIQHISQGNVSDCTGCQNLSNLTYQGTRVMCQIVQDVRTPTHFPGPLVCRIRQVSLYSGFTITFWIFLIWF
jgi:hypothetical protein